MYHCTHFRMQIDTNERVVGIYRIDQWWCKKHGNKSDRNFTLEN